MKSPPLQIHDVACDRVEAFIRGADRETLTGAEPADDDQHGRPSRSRGRASSG